VKMPRFRVSWLMAVVALAALNFAALREMFDFQTGQLLAVGALPMVNVLAVGLLTARHRPGTRPFLLGFEAFGVMALALYVVASFVNDQFWTPYVGPVIGLVDKTIGMDRPYVFFPIVYCVAVSMLGLPQLVFALIGGWLSRQYRIVITKRPAPTPPPA
jgi:hypothetical protein